MGLSLDQRVSRVLKAARDAGMVVARFTVSPTGEIEVFTGREHPENAAKDAAAVVSERIVAMRAARG